MISTSGKFSATASAVPSVEPSSMIILRTARFVLSIRSRLRRHCRVISRRFRTGEIIVTLFVGRRFVKRFLDLGDEVHCVDNLAPLSGAVAPGSGWFSLNPLDFDTFRFYQEDCRTYFQRACDDDFDYCFHLAAMVGGRLMIE